MAGIHDQLNKIINDFTETGIVDVSEEAQCFALALSSCVNDDLQKTFAIGSNGDGADLFKMNLGDLREHAQTLTEENKELKKQIDIRDYFEKHQRYYHARDHGRLMEISKLLKIGHFYLAFTEQKNLLYFYLGLLYNIISNIE
jgi:hypothetical protein